MRVLIAFASRHGATYEIAEAIGRALADRGLNTHVARVEDVDGVADFDAVVLAARSTPAAGWSPHAASWSFTTTSSRGIPRGSSAAGRSATRPGRTTTPR